jgi:hypothetical protein
VEAVALTLAQAGQTAARLHKELCRRHGELERREHYFEGKHPLAFASKEWQDFHGNRFKDFSDNWCEIVAASPAERIGVTGFRLGTDSDVLSDDERALMRDWDLNDMEAQQRQGFLTSSWAARSAVIVWGSPDGEPLVTWEDPEEVVVAYDPERRGVRTAALKTWRDEDSGVEYATLYLPDEVWRLQRNRGSGRLEVPPSAAREFGDRADWQLRDGATGPMLNPLGRVPVVEFRNRPALDGDPVSEIAGAMCMQDSINLLWSYLFGAADFASMPARVVMGQEPPKIPKLDAQGNATGHELVPVEQLKAGRMLWLTGQNTTIGQWDAANLETFTKVITIAVRHLAAQTRTPIHYIVGELTNVNGDTLIAGEAPLVKKVEDAQAGYTSPIREAFALMALVRNRADLAQECRVGRVGWKDAETRTQAQASDAALKDKQVGLSMATILARRYGMSQVEIARELDQIAAEQSDPQLDKVMGQIDLAAGQPGTQPPAVGIQAGAGA